MDEGRTDVAAAVRPGPAPLWRVARVSIELILDIIQLSRGPGDLLDPLIVATVLEGNLALFNQDPELQRAYADLDQPPPEAVRRPVSISSVANSLHLPYETVRRRANQLARAGMLTLTPKGAFVPLAMLTSADYVAAALARYERVKRFYFELQAMGVLQDLPAPEGERVATPPVRLVNRLASEYMSRLHESLLKRLGDPVRGVVLLEMARANMAGLDAAARRVEGPLPDHMRTPVTVAGLARRLRLPPETVRRHVHELEAQGLCRRARGGRLAEVADFRPAGLKPPIVMNLMNVSRLMTRLSTFGVLAFWDDEAQRVGPGSVVSGFQSEPPPG